MNILERQAPAWHWERQAPAWRIWNAKQQLRDSGVVVLAKLELGDPAGWAKLGPGDSVGWAKLGLGDPGLALG